MYKSVLNKRKVRGFTLTELMIVISIIGLISVLAVPNYKRFMLDWQLNGEAQHFASALRAARSAAILKNINVVFAFDMDNNEYFYFEDVDKDGMLDGDEYRSRIYKIKPGIEIAAYTLSRPVVIFGSKGNSWESGTIVLRNANSKVKGVRIYGGTGNITID